MSIASIQSTSSTNTSATPMTLPPPKTIVNNTTVIDDPPEEHDRYLNKLINLRIALETDLDACDIKWSLFVTAAQSYRYDSRLAPYPPNYTNEKTKDKFDIQLILTTIDQIPALHILLQKITQKLDNEIANDVVDLLHWVLCTLADPYLKTIQRKNFGEVLRKVDSIAPCVEPTHIFEIVPQPNSVAEAKFRKHSEHHRTAYAFHGSKMDSFHSILNFGLQQHLCKTALFGEGIYLSSERHVSMAFSPVGAGWSSSRCGAELSCIAICEFVDHPQHLKCHTEKKNRGSNVVPEKYFVITNNEIVRLRYLLIFGQKQCGAGDRSRMLTSHKNPIVNWLLQHKSMVSVCFYAVLLAAIGFGNSQTGKYFRSIFWRKAISWMDSVTSGSLFERK